MNIYYVVLMIIVGYLMGSIPIGYLIVKRKKGIDIRTVGSGSTGANNVASECGWHWGIVALICDLLKAYIPTVLVLLFLGFHWIVGPVGLFAVGGHIFPVLIPKPRFKGGKGVATAGGFLIPISMISLFIYPRLWVIATLCAILIIWGILIRFRKQMGVASLFLMSCVMLFFGLFAAFDNFPSIIAFYIAVMALLVHWAHWENWKRIFQGKERMMESKWEK